MRLVAVLSLLVLTVPFAVAQSVVTGAGYSSPVPVAVAPGQIITLFVHGIGEGLSDEVKTAEIPLPNSLAGISVTLPQTRGVAEVAVPLLSVCPLDSSCAGEFASDCRRLTAVTVQIPFELVPVDLPIGAPVSNQAVFTVTENGLTGDAVVIIPRSDSIQRSPLL